MQHAPEVGDILLLEGAKWCEFFLFKGGGGCFVVSSFFSIKIGRGWLFGVMIHFCFGLVCKVVVKVQVVLFCSLTWVSHMKRTVNASFYFGLVCKVVVEVQKSCILFACLYWSHGQNPRGKLLFWFSLQSGYEGSKKFYCFHLHGCTTCTKELDVLFCFLYQHFSQIHYFPFMSFCSSLFSYYFFFLMLWGDQRVACLV
jgi:hypothetical protein